MAIYINTNEELLELAGIPDKIVQAVWNALRDAGFEVRGDSQHRNWSGGYHYQFHKVVGGLIAHDGKDGEADAAWDALDAINQMHEMDQKDAQADAQAAATKQAVEAGLDQWFSDCVSQTPQCNELGAIIPFPPRGKK